MFEPILKATNSPVAQPFDHVAARQLEECDDVTTFTEGGQFYILGFKDRRRHVFAHCTKDAYERYLDPSNSDLEQYPGPFRGR